MEKHQFLLTKPIHSHNGGQPAITACPHCHLQGISQWAVDFFLVCFMKDIEGQNFQRFSGFWSHLKLTWSILARSSAERACSVNTTPSLGSWNEHVLSLVRLPVLCPAQMTKLSAAKHNPSDNPVFDAGGKLFVKFNAMRKLGSSPIDCEDHKWGIGIGSSPIGCEDFSTTGGITNGVSV